MYSKMLPKRIQKIQKSAQVANLPITELLERAFIYGYVEGYYDYQNSEHNDVLEVFDKWIAEGMPRASDQA